MNDSCPREVKRDRVGLFVYYGPCRFRPYKSRETKFNLGDVVNMVGAAECFFWNPRKSVRVYDADYGSYELWRRMPNERKN